MANYSTRDGDADCICPHCNTPQDGSPVEDYTVPGSMRRFGTSCESCGKTFYVQFADDGKYHITKG